VKRPPQVAWDFLAMTKEEMTLPPHGAQREKGTPVAADARRLGRETARCLRGDAPNMYRYPHRSLHRTHRSIGSRTRGVKGWIPVASASFGTQHVATGPPLRLRPEATPFAP
jgi:hypothetical protein